MKHNSSERTGLGWALLTLCFAAPWLIPVHSDPWTTLYSEVVAGLAVAALTIWILLLRSTPLGFDALSLGFALAAMIPLLQTIGGLFAFPWEAPIVSVYLLGFAVAVATARSCEMEVPSRLPDALFAALVIAALASTALALAQWLQLDWGPLLAPIAVGTRSMANVGQANELSTLLVWGLVGLWWANSRRSIGGVVTFLAAAVLLVGIATTQSRTGWLGVGLLLTFGVLSPSPLKATKYRAAFGALGIWFLMLVLGWTEATAVIGAGGAEGLESRLASGRRPEIWALMIDGISHRPWLGYGWNQGRLVQVAELPNYAHMNISIQHAHNLVLDLMVWNGVPLGLTLVALLGAWFWWQLRRTATESQALLLLGLAVFLMHCLLELPHCKSFFLAPVALMMGLLNVHAGMPVLIRVHRFASVALISAISSFLVIVCIEYRALELDQQSNRLRAAWLGTQSSAPAPNPHVLRALQTALLNLRIKPRPGMELAQIEQLRLNSVRYPTDFTLRRYAIAAALNGQPAAAKQALWTRCMLFLREPCDGARLLRSELESEHVGAHAQAAPSSVAVRP
jgi:O-antigen ligase